jgi:hypothetical protein
MGCKKTGRMRFDLRTPHHQRLTSQRGPFQSQCHSVGPEDLAADAALAVASYQGMDLAPVALKVKLRKTWVRYAEL